MNNVLIFKPIETIDPIININKFISFCKDSLFNPNLTSSWESSVWPKYYKFNKFDVKNNSYNKETLDDDFIDFAKAYMFHVHSFNKSKLSFNTLSILKLIEFVLLKIYKEANVTKCDNLVFDECARLASEKFSKMAAFCMGKELEKLSVFLNENRMTYSYYFNWVNPLRCKVEQTWSGYDVSLEGHPKLPNVNSITAIAEIFSKSDNDLSTRDVFTTAIFALLMCAPSRISEILSLPEDCEILEEDSMGVQRYGLRFFSAKGYEGNIKWVPTTMIPVAKKAIERLRCLSKNARELARVIEWNNLQDSNSLEKSINENKPKTFPWYDEEKNIKYSNALCLLNKNQLCKSRKVNVKMLYKPTVQFFIADIVDSNFIKGNFNIFKRHNYLNGNGSPYLLRTHQLRHLLNTFAQINGMDDFSIARWSGRKCISQNSFYDHRSHDQMANMIRENNLFGLTNEIPNKNIPVVNVDEFEALSSGAILVTKHGYCKHSYAFEPCRHYPVEDPGFENKIISTIHDKILEKTLNDKNEGNFNAEKWYEFQNDLIKGE